MYLVLSALLYLSPYSLTEIPQAIPHAEAKKLRSAGIVTSDDLLARAANPRERAALAKATSMAPRTLERYVFMADLLRIRGVGPEMVRLFAAAGIHTSRALGSADPATLFARMLRINDKLKITQNPPEEKSVATWIEKAKQLPQVLQ